MRSRFGSTLLVTVALSAVACGTRVTEGESLASRPATVEQPTGGSVSEVIEPFVAGPGATTVPSTGQLREPMSSAARKPGSAPSATPAAVGGAPGVAAPAGGPAPAGPAGRLRRDRRDRWATADLPMKV